MAIFFAALMFLVTLWTALSAGDTTGAAVAGVMLAILVGAWEIAKAVRELKE